MDKPHGLYVLASNSSRQWFPENSPTSFTCLLPETLRKSSFPDHKFHVRLVSIALGTASSDRPVGYVKVHLQELEPQRSGEEFTQVVGGFQFPPAQIFPRTRYGMHTFKHPTLLPLRLEELQSFQVRLTDQWNQELLIEDNFPTVLLIEIAEAGMEDTFTVVCDSRQGEHFPNNKLAEFTTPLPTELNLAGYEVALYSLVYPPLMRESVTMASVAIEAGEVSHSFEFRLDAVPTTSFFIRRIQIALQNSVFAEDLIFGEIPNGPHQGSAFFHMRAGSDRPYLKVTPDRHFTLACGQCYHPRTTTTLHPGQFFLFEGKPNIFLALPNPIAMVECDVVETGTTTGVHANLMQYAPLLKGIEAYHQKIYEPEQLLFHTVVDKPFNSIKISLKEPAGQVKALVANPEDSLQAVLLFRRKREN